MALKTDAIGKEWDPATFEVEAERVRKYADAIGADSELHHDADAAKAAGFRDLVAPPMFCVVYSAPAMGPAILDPEVGINFPAMVHGGQAFEWGEPVCAGDVITTTARCDRDLREGRQGLLRVREQLHESGRGRDRARHLDQHRQGRLSVTEPKPGDAVPELTVTPDAGLTKRYAEASGDPNPIHIDPDFAKSAGLPGIILHGLWTMAQVARGNAALAGGDPRSLKRLSVQFRGMGFPEQEVTVSGTVKEVDGDRVVVDTVAEQGGNQIIRNAEAELELP